MTRTNSVPPPIKQLGHPLVVMSGLTLIAFIIRLYHLGARSLWYDELLHLDVARAPLNEINSQLIRHAGMPLDYYLLHGWIKLGRHDAWVRFPALFWGVLAVPLIYVLGRRLFGKQVGYLAAALLAFSSFAVSYSQEVRPYALLLCMVMVAYVGLWQAYQTHRIRYWAVAILGLAGAVLSHYFALFMLVPLGLFVGIQQLVHLKRLKFWCHTAFYGLSLVILTLIVISTGRLPTLYSVGDRFVRESYQLDKYMLPAEEKINGGSGPPIEPEFFVEKVLMPLGTVRPSVLLLYTAFFLIALLSLLRYRSRHQAAVLLTLGWLILPVILIYAFLLYRGTFYATRYILYTLPAYLLLVSYGISVSVNVILRLNFHRLKYLLQGGLLVLALAPLLLAQADQLLSHYRADSREDWRAVGQLLQANAGADDVVIAVRAEPTMSWYYPPAAAPFDRYGRSQPIWEALNRHQRRWFVLSSYSFKQDQGLRDWLRNQGAIKIAIDRRVVVHFHEEGQTPGQMLAQVKTFSLPQKALTYRVLADQFRQNGDMATSRAFYQRAEELAKAPAAKAGAEARLGRVSR